MGEDGAGAGRTVAEARDYFPRGLSQPATGYRFSLDALLLAEFANLSGVVRVADLGCGCGVVGLALMLRQARAETPPRPGKELRVTGIDRNPEMIACATQNAARLGFADRYEAVHADVATLRDNPAFTPESFDLVVCNPPYREPGRGRRCPDPDRDAARFETGATTADFIRASAYLLKNRKRAAFITLPERLETHFSNFSIHRLVPKRLASVHPNHNSPSKMVLSELLKNGGRGMLFEAPIIIDCRGVGI